MTHLYTNLGAIPRLATASAERRDPLLAHTGPAARRLMAAVRRYPAAQQVQVLDRALAQFQPGTPQRVRRVATFLRRQGLSTTQAVERALALALADSTMEKIKGIGVAYQHGQLMPMGGLGDEASTSGTKPEDVVAGMFQGILCSSGLQTTVVDAVGRGEGQDAATATAVGYGVAQGIAQCPTTTPPATTPAPVSEPERPSLVWPIAMGIGALALVGGVVWVSRKK